MYALTRKGQLRYLHKGSALRKYIVHIHCSTKIEDRSKTRGWRPGVCEEAQHLNTLYIVHTDCREEGLETAGAGVCRG